LADFVTLYVPETVPVVAAVTGAVVMANVAVFAPAGTVTLAGIVAAALVVVNVTTAPISGAMPFRVTVPVEELPPTSVAGLKVTDDSAAAVTVRFALFVSPR
jgi:hypothetical protein